MKNLLGNIKKNTFKKFLILSIFSFLPSSAQAYIDPGSGSILISVIIGIFTTFIFSIKGYYFKIKNFLLANSYNKTKTASFYKIVFYSEGSQYWLSFKEIITELDCKNIKALYLTSDVCDPALRIKFKNIHTQYIGRGNVAFAELNTLEANIVVMTTPGLDVLQIRRSKGVKHYSYIPHSPVDMGTYKLYSFENFDSIFLTGAYQRKTIRALEKLRGTQSKLLVNAGCPYMDALDERLHNSAKENEMVKNRKNVVLIAPTWGRNNLLRLFGAQPIISLLNSGFEVIIRPHPQSYVQEKVLLEDIAKDLSNFSNLTWDNSPDNFDTLQRADIMISSLSGVVLDFALIFEKPVVTVEFEYDFTGQDANDLPFELWELSCLNQFSRPIKPQDFVKLTEIIHETLAKPDKNRSLRNFRSENLFNRGISAKVIANKIQILGNIDVNTY